MQRERQARRLLEPHPGAMRHAQLLVAHPFSGESMQEVASSIRQCEGLFTCDCRGLGVNWEVSQLRKISSALLGTVDIVPKPQWLEAEIVAMTDSAMSKTAAGMHLRLRPAPGTRIRFVRQVAPAAEDLTGRGTAPADETAAQDYPTGAWRPGETRDYHIGLETTLSRPACSTTAVIRDAQGARPASETVWVLPSRLRRQPPPWFRRQSAQPAWPARAGPRVCTCQFPLVRRAWDAQRDGQARNGIATFLRPGSPSARVSYVSASEGPRYLGLSIRVLWLVGS
jgi:hypothetical protein